MKFMKHSLWSGRIGGWFVDLTIGTNLMFGVGLTHSKGSSTIVWWQFFFGPFAIGCFQEWINY